MLLEALELPLGVIDKGFNAALGVAAAGVTALVGAMGLAIKSTFNWANELDGIQDIMGVTNGEAAALNFTLRKSGVDVQKLTGGMTILAKGLVKADGTLDTTGKALKSFGINALDVNGKVKNQSDLLSEISKKYNSFGTQTEKVNFLTEAFGRSGADLVDFFDTLASEGGIEDVTEKVERLGLVIDPGRYEQFTRSLEELKLVGLGLAVGFTENVMPMFERFLEIVTGPGKLSEKIAALAGEADTFIGGVIDSFATSIDTWVAGGGPEELSNKIVSWIEGIGTGEAFDSKILSAVGRVVTAFGAAMGAVNWDEIGTALDVSLTEQFNRGEEAIDLWWATTATQAITQWSNTFSTWFATEFERAGHIVENTINDLFTNLWNSWSSGITNWGVNAYNSIITWINKLIEAFNSMPILPDGVYQNTIPLATGGRGGGPRPRGGRASGGPVIKGQVYDVLDTYKAEGFVAPASGRVDPVQAQQPMQIDYDRLINGLGQQFKIAVQTI